MTNIDRNMEKLELIRKGSSQSGSVLRNHDDSKNQRNPTITGFNSTIS
jgi:hypothetical protein